MYLFVSLFVNTNNFGNVMVTVIYSNVPIHAPFPALGWYIKKLIKRVKYMTF